MTSFLYGQCIVTLTFCFLYCALGDKETQVVEIFHVTSDVRYRFATTEMISVIRNVDEDAQEISFEAALPEEAFIASFSMTIDGKVYDGEIKKKETAQEEFKVALDSGQSAGLIEQAPRESNVFVVSVNVASGSTVSFSLTYQELLQRKHGVYEHQIHVNHDQGQPIDDFLIEVFIQDKNKLTFVKPFALHSDSLLSNSVEADSDGISLNRPTPETAHIAYKPSQEQQADNEMSTKFVVQFDVEHSHNGDIVVVDGYFIHFFAADVPLIPKDIIFVLDISGSMSGNKINQLKDAMNIILNDLQTDDRFNILTFHSEIGRWKNELVMVESETIQEAHEFVENLNGVGATDINKALLEAINVLNNNTRSDHIGMIFFLTDGKATSGEKNCTKIADNILKHNKIHLAIFGLAFGSNADYDLLKKISVQNSGFARKIYEASDAALQVAGLYNLISNVSMLNATINYLPRSVNELTITDNTFPIIFKGSEIVVSGKLADDAKNFKAEINGIQNSGKVLVILESNDFTNFIASSPFFNSSRDFSSIVEKMWAYLTIKQLEEEKERHSIKQERLTEIDERIINMSLKYKFVTSLMAMIVKKPEEENSDALSLESDNDQSAENEHHNREYFNHPRKHLSRTTFERPVSNGRRGYSYQRSPTSRGNLNDRKHYSQRMPHRVTSTPLRKNHFYHPRGPTGDQFNIQTPKRQNRKYYHAQKLNPSSVITADRHFSGRFINEKTQTKKNIQIQYHSSDELFLKRPKQSHYQNNHPTGAKPKHQHLTTVKTRKPAYRKSLVTFRHHRSQTTPKTQTSYNIQNTTKIQKFYNTKTNSRTKSYTSRPTQGYQHMKRLPSITPKYQASLKNLPVLTITSEKENMCIVLKNLSVGHYRLLTSNTGASVNLGVSCSLYQQCTSASIKSASFGKSFVTINVEDLKTSHWNFIASPSFHVTDIGNILTINGEGMFIKISRTVNGESQFYDLEMKLDSKKKYTGIIGDMLHHPVHNIRKLKPNIPSVCKNIQNSKIFVNNMALRYLIKY